MEHIRTRVVVRSQVSFTYLIRLPFLNSRASNTMPTFEICDLILNLLLFTNTIL